MKILVTGGAGFIASHIADAYIKNGHQVSVIDNLSTGKKANVHPKTNFYKEDIKDLSKLEKIFLKEKPEVISHHAAIAEVLKSIENPLPTLDVNVNGTINLLRLAKKFGIKKFIFASTGGAIYGQAKKIPAKENTPETPLSPYGFSKLMGEHCIKFFAQMANFEYLIFRYPNVYGPRQNPKGEAGVVAIFSELLKNKKQPTIYGDGSKGRDYVYIDDVVRANVLALAKGKNEILNLGRGKLITDQEVFHTIASIMKTEIDCCHAPFRPGEVYRIALDATRAKKILHWQSKISFKEGVGLYLASRKK